MKQASQLYFGSYIDKVVVVYKAFGPTSGFADLEPKRVSGTYNALYKDRGSLYTKLTHTFIYFPAMLNIEEKE
jgi:hypothetical protein